MKKIFLFLTLLMFISCASGVIYQPLTDIKYSPTNKIDVFISKKPTRQYKEIGRINITEGLGGEGDMIQVAIKKTKEVGADEIILAADEKEMDYLVQDYPDIDSTMIIPASHKKLTFIAIKDVEKEWIYY